MSTRSMADRRAFLRFLAASPIVAYAGVQAGLLGDLLARPAHAQEMSLAPRDAVVIKSVSEALTVMDFDAAARATLSAPHYMWVTDGSFYNETVRANREGLARYSVRLRRLTGIDRVDQSVEIFGVKWESPIFFCPVGGMNAFHRDAPLLVARAAKSTRTLQILSATAGRPEPELRNLEEVNAARGQAVWVACQGPAPTPATVKRIQTAGCPVLVWTVDSVGGGNTIGAKSIQHAAVANLDREADPRCAGCHATFATRPRIHPSDSMDVIGAVGALKLDGASPTWDDVKRIKDSTPMKLVLKGIVTREDAELAVRHGADAIIVSNHGGHADASGRGTIECLPEVLAGAAGKVPVLVDGGFRSGVDAFKALALGATAVGVGRPHMWGLAAFGQEGIEAVAGLLRRELQVIMAQAGAPAIDKIRRDSLVTRG